jgi:AcrR family transcriptional regulator
MPPKGKPTREEIINTAFEIVRQSGEQFLNARTIAKALNCSTQPVFSNFASMNELRLAVVEKADALCKEFAKREVESGKFPPYKAHGMAYIRFAKEEKELFKLLFMCDRKGKEFVPTSDFEASVEAIMKSNNLKKEKAELMHLEMWTCVHGIGSMLATSFLELDFELISRMLSDVYQGIRRRHLEEN